MFSFLFSGVCVLKLNNTGNYLWSKTFGAAGHETSRGLSINSSNGITIAGRYLNTVDFDPGPAVVNKTALTVDIYILQLDANGNFNWVKTLDGPLNNSTQVNDLLIDKNDNILLTGHFRDSIDMDPGPATAYLVDTAINYYDMFLLKLDASGNYTWAKQFSCILGNGAGVSILTYDSLGNYYLSGTFNGTMDFDFSAATNNLSAPKSCAYISKMDSNANFIWAAQMGGFSGIAPEYETVLDVAIDAQSNVTLCGSFKGYEDFDPGPGVYYLGQPGNISHTHGFIMQLDNGGSLNWAKNLGEQPSAASANGIVLNSQGSIYASGDFWDNTDFDFNAGTQNILSQGAWDAFVLKLKGCTPKTSTDVINSCKPIIWMDGITYSSSNFTTKDTLSSADGCDSTVSLNLTITPIDTSITKSGGTLTANATGISYQWVSCENNFTPIVGETNQSFTPSVNGSYAVILNNGSCADTSNCYSFTVLSTSDFLLQGIAVFPNPTKGHLSITTPGQTLMLSLYNALGQEVFTKSINRKNSSIDISKIAKGLYTYTFKDDNHVVFRGKLLLE